MKKLLLGLLMACASGGCAYLNGDAMCLSDGQKEVVISGGLSTLFDMEYSFKESNLPFSFKVLRNQEFGHIGHSLGSLDFSKGGYIEENSVLRFSIQREGMPDAAEFLVSNGVLKVVKACKQFLNAERRTGPNRSDARAIGGGELWSEPVMGKLICMNIGNCGFSFHLHKLGEYGVVYNYDFPLSDNGRARLIIKEIKNLRWFHWASL